MAINPNEVVSKGPVRNGANDQKEGQAEEQKGASSRFKSMKGLVAGLAVVASLTGVAASSCSEDSANPPDIPACTQDGGCMDGGDTDTSTDSGTDTDSGTETDSGTDTDSGTETDSGTTTDSGTETDSGTDSGPALCAEASEGEFSGIIQSATPETVGGYVFEYLGKSGLNAHFKISCGGATVEEFLVCPLGSDTVRDTAEGRRITINPIAAGASVVNTSIDVEVI